MCNAFAHVHTDIGGTGLKPWHMKLCPPVTAEPNTLIEKQLATAGMVTASAHMLSLAVFPMSIRI